MPDSSSYSDYPRKPRCALVPDISTYPRCLQNSSYQSSCTHRHCVCSHTQSFHLLHVLWHSRTHLLRLILLPSRCVALTMYLPVDHTLSTYQTARRANVTPDHVRCYSPYSVVYCRVPRLPSTPVFQRLSPTCPAQPWPRGVYLDVITPIIVLPTPPIVQQPQRPWNHEIFHPRPGRLLAFLPVVWDYSTTRRSRDLRVLCESNYLEPETNRSRRAHFTYLSAHDVRLRESTLQLTWCVCDLPTSPARTCPIDPEHARTSRTPIYQPMCVFTTPLSIRA